MVPVHNSQLKLFYSLIALVATIPRLLFIFLAPEAVGDGVIYSRVAENILNGCGVSLSLIGSGECVPHFGGNQGPGYPAFIALIWWFSGHSDLVVRLAQGGINVVAIIYLVHAIWQYTSSPKTALLAGLVLALSPLEVAWSRYIFTETLAISGSIFLFAELLKSLHESRLRVIPIAIILVCTTFIRLDGILLVIPVAIAGFIIHRPPDALRKGIVIALILGLSWGGWLWRNLNAGLNIFSPLAVEYKEASKGLNKWGTTWSTNQYEYAAWGWPSNIRNYNAIRIDEKAYYANSERQKVLALLEELKDYSGQPIPKHINDQFAELAIKRIHDEPLAYYLLIPGKRIWSLWANIYDSFGWPISLGGALTAQERTEIVQGGLGSKFLFVLKYPIQVMGKLVVNGWKLSLYLLFLFAVIKVYKDRGSEYRNIMTLILSFILARSIFSGLMNHVESRYILMQTPVMEVVVVMVVGHAIIKRRKNSQK